MKCGALWLVSLAALVTTGGGAEAGATLNTCTVQFLTVDKDVKLEVLDWGGQGRPVILLAALGATAQVYDSFAPKLATRYHVYGITRRGFGASSVPVSGYSADQLGDDVLKVIDLLKLNRPIILGHSMAGEELSSVGSRHPDKIAGLIYLEAAFSYAFYDPKAGDLRLDGNELRDKIDQLVRGKGVSDPRPLLADMLGLLPQFEKDLRDTQKQMEGLPGPEKNAAPPPDAPLPIQEMFAGEQKYTSVNVPLLAVFAYPHAFAGMFQNDPEGRAKAESRDIASIDSQVKIIEAEAPAAHVVRIPHAKHMIFISNEADVLREIDAFITGLPGT
jgi:non-heme chloroperoxidase